jgi:hypothetical protein
MPSEVAAASAAAALHVATVSYCGSWLIWQIAIRRELRRAQHALAQVLHKLIRGDAIALAGAVGRDHLRGRAQRDVGILVANGKRVFGAADERSPKKPATPKFKSGHKGLNPAST